MSILGKLLALAGWGSSHDAHPRPAVLKQALGEKPEPAIGCDLVRIPGTPFIGVWLDVPYSQKDLAAIKGAVFHKPSKRWYAPQNVDLRDVKRWLPQGLGQHQQSADDAVIEFGRALLAAGLVLPGRPDMTGSLQRVPVETGKGRAKDGAYVGWIVCDRVSGYIQNFKTGYVEHWTQGCDGMRDDERIRYLAELDKARKARDAEIAAMQEEAARESEVLWARASDKPFGRPNSYLAKKGVGAHGVRFSGASLVVPLRDIDGRIWSLQYITSQKKQLKSGGRKIGNFHLIGEVCNDQPLLVAEGYATGASLHEATNLPVAVAIDAGNLDHVVAAFRGRYPQLHIMICGDDDRGSDVNNGRAKAQAAAAKHGAGVVFPVFVSGDSGSDYNDLHVASGVGVVREQVMMGIERHASLLFIG